MVYKALFAECFNCSNLSFDTFLSKYTDCFLEVYKADSFEMVLDILEKEKVDSIFLSLSITDKSSFDFLKTIRDKYSDVFVVLVSTVSNSQNLQSVLNIGFVDYAITYKSENDFVSQMIFISRKIDELLVRKYAQTMVTACLKSTSADFNDDFVLKLGELFTNKLKDGLTMEEAASTLGFSKDYFGKMVKRKFGTSFNNLFTHIKMQYAQFLLSSGEYKIYEVCSIVGYANPDYFTRLFKAEFGFSPSSYVRGRA